MSKPTLSELVTFRQAEAGGFIIFKDNAYHCPSDPSCFDCPFTKVCDKYNSAHPGVIELDKLPEWSLPLADLQKLYPECFI